MARDRSCDGFPLPPCTPHPNLLQLSCRALQPCPAACGGRIRCSGEPDKNGSEQLWGRSEPFQIRYHMDYSLHIFSEQFGDDFQHLTSYLAENCHLLLLCPLRLGGIHETVMDASSRLAGPHRALLRSRIAHGYNEIEILCLQFSDLLGLA